jgi:hypothetical protein
MKKNSTVYTATYLTPGALHGIFLKVNCFKKTLLVNLTSAERPLLMNPFQSEFLFGCFVKIVFVFASLFTNLISLQAPFANSRQATFLQTPRQAICKRPGNLFANAQATFLQTPRQPFCKCPDNIFANTQATFLQTPRQPFCKHPGSLFANAPTTFLQTPRQPFCKRLGNLF